MKLYTTIPAKLRPFYTGELEKYQVEYSNNNLSCAWIHLERAHIIGQKYPIPHTSVHWKMLRFGFKIKSRKEIIGQLPRLVFGGVKSFVGTIPVGNPGGANVPPLKPFPIDGDLKEMFVKAGLIWINWGVERNIKIQRWNKIILLEQLLWQSPKRPL